MILPFDVNQQTVSRSAVTSIPRKGSREYLYLSFTFSDDWTDLTKTLYVSSETYSDGIIIEEGVPVQVPTYYTQQNSFSITLCGIKGNEFVPTNIVTVLLEESNDTWEEIAPDPESIPYQQLIAMVQKAIESMHAPYINTETKTWMQWSIEQNMFVDTGIVAVGAQGAPGADGHTPVKGIDYWTDADKTEIVNDVLANIPTGGGETWRLVQDITLETDDVGTIEFTTDSDGKALNLKKFALIGKAKASAAANTYITINGKMFFSSVSPYQSYNLRPFQFQGDFCKGFLTLQLVGAINSAINGVSMYTHIYSGNFSTSALEKIEGSGLTQLKISPQTATVTFSTGSHVELWGVDA